MKHRFKIWFLVIAVIVGLWFWLGARSLPEQITYGVSFSKFHADELGLDWRRVYLAILDELKVKNIRLSAHWPMVEPVADQYNFGELDFQMAEAQKRGVPVILAVGRRLPGWPECHEPDWLRQSGSTTNYSLPTTNYKQERILEYIEQVVNRYKGYPNLRYWQVENEPFLGFFGRAHCGKPNEEFLRQEIALVRQIDPGHPIVITDSGEFGSWYRAYRSADVFGSSMYLYVWSRALGPIRYPIGPSFFRVKQGLVDLVYGAKPKVLIELSAEPWLLKPIVDTSIATQLERMGIDKFNEIIKFARASGFADQYLWGAEWWYWMSEHGHGEFWNRARELFSPQ